LNVGYDLGVISLEMFTILVVMALVTTALTGPLAPLARALLRSGIMPRERSLTCRYSSRMAAKTGRASSR